MSGVVPEPAPRIAEDEVEATGISRSDLVARLGEASGNELFERIDGQFRRGNRLFGATVRAARQSFSAVTPGHAQLVMPRRAAGARAGETTTPEEGMVVISLSDLEAVVKASQPDFDWAAAFAPRSDLPVATTPVVVRSGVPGRRMLRP